MNVTVNGRARRIAPESTVGEVVPRADWSTALHEDDRVEVLIASQGG